MFRVCSIPGLLSRLATRQCTSGARRAAAMTTPTANVNVSLALCTRVQAPLQRIVLPTGNNNTSSGRAGVTTLAPALAQSQSQSQSQSLCHRLCDIRIGSQSQRHRQSITMPYQQRRTMADIVESGALMSGMTVRYKDKLFIVKAVDRRMQGRGSAMIAVELRDIDTGAKVPVRLRTSEKLERIRYDYKKVQFLYKDSNLAYFMDMETFEQIEMPLAAAGDGLGFVEGE
jgi:translation elongation factor P/translation initiation factor 5A